MKTSNLGHKLLEVKFEQLSCVKTTTMDGFGVLFYCDGDGWKQAHKLWLKKNVSTKESGKITLYHLLNNLFM